MNTHMYCNIVLGQRSMQSCILMVTGKLHNCLKQPQKKSYAPTDSNIDWREVERSANKQMM